MALRLFETEISLTPHNKQQSLYQLILSAIRLGKLEANDKLPSTRLLAEQLHIARSTVKTVYEILQAEGYVETRRGSGTFVANLPELPSYELSTYELPTNEPPATSEPHATSSSSSLNAPVVSASANTLNDSLRQRLHNEQTHHFLPAQPAMDHFPHNIWHKVSKQALRESYHCGNPDLAGDPLLRHETALFLRQQRGVNCTADNLIITSGSQQALYLMLRILLNAGDTVLLEGVGYQGVDLIVNSLGVNNELISENTAASYFTSTEANNSVATAAIVTPSRSFPLGETMPLSTRKALLDWATRHERWIIEDDYDSEFNFSGHSIAALQGLDSQQRVIYTGTFSRTMFPGIRLGYLVVPPSLTAHALRLRSITDGGLSTSLQRSLAYFMNQGHYNRHLRRMRKLYQSRKALLNALVDKHLPELTLQPNKGGMHDCYFLPDALTDKNDENTPLDQSIEARANQAKLGIRALSRYSRSHPKRQGIVIGFGSTDEADMEAGIIKLAGIIRSY